MTALAILGWAVVHSLWQGAIVAGLTAVAVSFLGDRHAATRGRIASLGLALMVVLPIVTVATGAEIVGPAVRSQAALVADRAVSLPTFLEWRAVLVPAAAVLWAAGFTFWLVRIGGEWRRARALRRRHLAAASPGVRRAVADLRAALAIATRVDVFRSKIAGVPMVMGWWRPVILLPWRSTRQLDEDQVRAVLAHELAHVGRGDYLANLVQLAADALLFHHPAARWVSRRIRIEREYCCDDVAVAAGHDPRTYARALAALEDARGGCLIAVAAASGTLLDRIERIVGRPRRTITPARAAIALAGASLAAAIVLACVAVVPPSIPLDAKLRMRSPAPPGASVRVPSSAASAPRKRSSAPGAAPVR